MPETAILGHGFVFKPPRPRGGEHRETALCRELVYGMQST